MTKGNGNGALDTIKDRLAGLQGLWKPVGITLSIITTLRAGQEFIKRKGAFSYPVLIFLAVAVLLLLSVPIRATRRFVFRGLAFLLDVLLLGLITFAVLFVCGGIFGEPSGLFLMLVAWLWFAYFVLFDWRFKGTPGKRFFGLTIVSIRKGGGNVLTSFIRAFLTICLPIIGAAWISEALDMDSSRFRFLAGMSLRGAILSVVPVSILLLGGNQGVVDKLLGSNVETEAKSEGLHGSETSMRSWFLLCLSSSVCGLLFGTLIYLAAFGQPRTNEPSDVCFESQIDDPPALGRLWTWLPYGLRHPEQNIRRIRLIETNCNPFSTEDSRMIIPAGYEQEFKEFGKRQHKTQIVRILLAPSVPPAVHTLIMENLSKLVAPTLGPHEIRFVVLEFDTDEDFGFFNTTLSQNTLICLTRNGNKWERSITDLIPPGYFSPNTSLEKIRWLFLGDAEALEVIRH